MILTRGEFSLLYDQVAKDTVWCFPCGIAGRSVRAVVRYVVAGADMTATVVACGDCFKRAMAEQRVFRSEAVSQPAHVLLLGRLLPALVEPPALGTITARASRTSERA